MNKENLHNLCGLASVTELAEALQVSRQTATQALKGLGGRKTRAKLRAIIIKHQREKAKTYEALARIATASANAMEAIEE